MSNEDVMTIVNASKRTMSLLSKVQYLAEIQMLMPVGESNTSIIEKVDVLYEIDKTAKKAYIRTSRMNGNKTEINEFYYGNSASYVQRGKYWVKESIAANQYEQIFDKLELPGEALLEGTGFQMKSGDDVVILSSSSYPEQYAKSIFEKIRPYNGNLTQELHKATATIEINKKNKLVERVTLEAEGSFGELNHKQVFSEKSMLTVRELPSDYKINLPENAIIDALGPGMENLSLQDANTLSQCNCTGCSACTACLACLACIACIFPPLLLEVSASAIFAAIAASVSISFGVARAAQTS